MSSYGFHNSTIQAFSSFGGILCLQCLGCMGLGDVQQRHCWAGWGQAEQASRGDGPYLWITKQLISNNLFSQKQLHALACCLKAVATSDASLGIEELRLACGGHGYSDSSNLPTTYGLVTAMCTYEGENTVMLLQTARYLVKSWRHACNKKPLPPTINYLTKFYKGVKNRPWKNTLTCIIRAHEAVAAGYVLDSSDDFSIFACFHWISQ